MLCQFGCGIDRSVSQSNFIFFEVVAYTVMMMMLMMLMMMMVMVTIDHYYYSGASPTLQGS